jgi:hypothetical protein
VEPNVAVERMASSPRRRSVENADPEVSSADRTRVIIMSQVVVVVALLVLWSILRSRRSRA